MFKAIVLTVARFNVEVTQDPNSATDTRLQTIITLYKTEKGKNRFTVCFKASSWLTPHQIFGTKLEKALSSDLTIRNLKLPERVPSDFTFTSRIGFIKFVEHLGHLLDNLDGCKATFLGYREECLNGHTIEENLQSWLPRRTYRLCHISSILDSTAWDRKVSGIGLTPENAAKKLGVTLLPGKTINLSYYPYVFYHINVPIENLDTAIKGLSDWAREADMSLYLIEHSLVLVEVTDKK